MSKYDIVIVGSGLGGLVCANTLSKEGFKVCVLEKNATLGGCLQSFKRKDALFDTGIHYVGCLDEGQILNQYFKYLNILDKLKLRRLDSNGHDIINIDGTEYKHVMGHENFIENLSSRFPNERKGIQNVVEAFKTIGGLINVDTLRRTNQFSLSGLSYFSTSAADFLRQSVADPKLQDVLAGTAVLSGGEADSTSLYVFAMVTNSNIESAYRFVDGNQQVADLLVEEIRKNGGEVFSNAEVTRFIVDNELIHSVEINHGDLIEGTHFISGIHPARTLELTEKTKSIKKAYITRINSLRESMGFFTVNLALKENRFEYLNRNYYYYDAHNNAWTTPDYANQKNKKILFCTSASSASDNYCKVAQILEPMYWHELSKWEHTTVEKRGDDYKAFKQQKAERLIDTVEKFHPGLKNAIKTYYTSTPLTYRDYTSTKEGSAYGIIKDFHSPMASLLPSKTRIPNLYFTGQNNNVHGMIGVILTAMYTCSEFTGVESLAKKIGNA